jgi:DNA-binding transcriptional LysR family regulator
MGFSNHCTRTVPDLAARSTLDGARGVLRVTTGTRRRVGVLYFPERMALRLAPLLGLRVYEAPVELAPISLALIWHCRDDNDAGCAWFRQQIVQVARSLG